MIHAKDVREITRELGGALEDLIREYGLDDPAKFKSKTAGRVGKHFAGTKRFDLNPDVMEVASERGRTTSELLEATVSFGHAAQVDDQVLSLMVEALIGAMWMQGLMTGIALGRKFPAEKA
jgi:hypothetical protein